MNDFTKEELLSLKLHIDTSLAQCDHTENLITKIQSMIDNYCEHEEEYEDFNYNPMRCKKCLEITA